jgi:hypothetical protein
MDLASSCGMWILGAFAAVATLAFIGMKGPGVPRYRRRAFGGLAAGEPDGNMS